MFAPSGNLAKLEPMVCPGCGRWVIVQQTGVWDTYDAGIIRDGDIAVAIILDKRLARIEWNNVFRQPVLVEVCGQRGIRPDGLYLAGHECARMRVSSTGFTPPRKERPPGKPVFDAHLSDEEIAEFERLWNMPLADLKKRKAPTERVGQGE
ncbi:hypothetical protein BBSC_1997 [Bifidobacterium scardovii JCM 12489 = DSM 13734]|nr:hypothetical protein BBSC_1997 [Bifidobacterium scardovii JCM 12489 = DSM 13734]